MTTETITRDEIIQRMDAEIGTLAESHQAALADLAAAELVVTETESKYAQALMTGDQKTIERAHAARDKAARGRQFAADRVDLWNRKGTDVSTERNELVSARQREEQQAALAKVSEDWDRINRAYFNVLRQALAMAPPGSSFPVELLYGGRDLIQYLTECAEVQGRAEAFGVRLMAMNSGAVRLMHMRGMLSPGYTGTWDPTTVA